MALRLARLASDDVLLACRTYSVVGFYWSPCVCPRSCATGSEASIYV